jgi:excinuclease ABC subunit A
MLNTHKQPIEIINARTHNLKNISLVLNRNRLTVITGVSGSGKSSLAFDTLYAEGQRRYVESLSSYARQFLERMDRPDVDEIRGIAPAIAIEQKNPTRTSRSTVGTTTEIQDYLRLLFSRIGTTICPDCRRPVKKDSVTDIVDFILHRQEKTRIVITFPFSLQSYKDVEHLKEMGFYRLYLNHTTTDLDSIDSLIFGQSVDVVVDRLIVKPEIADRASDSVELALRHGHGYTTLYLDKSDKFSFSQHFECPHCSRTFTEPEPRLFTFNNPYGACPNCKGFGDIIHIDPDRVIPDPTKSLSEGAILPWRPPTHRDLLQLLLKKAPQKGIDIDIPYKELAPESKKLIWDGFSDYPGVHAFFKWLESKRYKISARVLLSRYRGYIRCPDCRGSRLRKDALNVFVGGKTLADLNGLNIEDIEDFFKTLVLTEFEKAIAGQILKELQTRLSYLNTIGLGYLSLGRRTSTLSGGEFQRINLASALGSQLVGSLYILDEPTIGLHPRDTKRLLDILKSLRDIGNTVIVVEHDREMIEQADQIIDLGPRAGEHGGEIVFQGSIKNLPENGNSLTAAFLRNDKKIDIPEIRRPALKENCIEINKAREHNLKNIDIQIPLQTLCVITGVSGSGKSTLVHDILYASWMKSKKTWNHKIGQHSAIQGFEHLDDIVMVDQSPIGRTPRSNPATFIKMFDFIRQVFAQTRQSKIYGLKPGAFSFNVSGGRCETCQGSGVVKVEMQFLADLLLTCEECGGKRFKKDILDITYQGKNIADILNMTVNQAIEFFSHHKQIRDKCNLLADVGLGYIRLGQSATTLSGGEAQRVKLAAHLGEKPGKKILYIFDEPTTGLSFADVKIMLDAFDRILDRGQSLVVIEHNMDVIKYADYIIDLGPEGGDKGGYVVAQGTPENIASVAASFTGQHLRPLLPS